MLEVAVVGIVVAVAIAYTAWALVPAGTRASLVRRLAAATSQGNPPRWLSRFVARLEAAANQGTGPCRDCGAHPPPGKDPPP
jgi:hypothetical protein